MDFEYVQRNYKTIEITFFTVKQYSFLNTVDQSHIESPYHQYDIDIFKSKKFHFHVI